MARTVTVECGNDVETTRTVAAYAAMLLGPGTGNADQAKRLYIASGWADGSPGQRDQPSGTLSAPVEECLRKGVAGLPPITIVTAWSDPRIPKDGSHLPADHIGDGGKFVLFGEVPVSGSTVTSSITVTSGPGDLAGGEYAIAITGCAARLIGPTGESWTS